MCAGQIYDPKVDGCCDACRDQKSTTVRNRSLHFISEVSKPSGDWHSHLSLINIDRLIYKTR